MLEADFLQHILSCRGESIYFAFSARRSKKNTTCFSKFKDFFQGPEKSRTFSRTFKIQGLFKDFSRTSEFQGLFKDRGNPV
jgi:hypothetical protein